MRVATDIGGTFTDLIYLDEATGEIGMTKASTTPRNFAIGLEDTLEKSGINVADTTFFIHGSTIIINALTERKGVKTGLITTQGFRDVLAITRANRPDIYNMYYTKPEPFVPRYLRLGVRERVNYKGEELEPLNGDDVRQAAEFFREEQVEAIAVCFLHSYANSNHEARCGELLRELLPGIPVTLSHEITKEWREYERTNTTVLNAYVQPIAVHYLNALEKDLSEMGMRPVGHIMQSNGGIATFEMARRAPIRTCESGPVAGVIGAAVIGDLLGEPNVISLDIGGTTVKSSLVERLSYQGAYGGRRGDWCWRRLYRLDRQSGLVACGAGQRGRGTWPGLLRHRWRETNRHRCQPGGRAHQPRLLFRGRDQSLDGQGPPVHAKDR
jgi:N-methylhydantoinase A